MVCLVGPEERDGKEVVLDMIIVMMRSYQFHCIPSFPLVGIHGEIEKDKPAIN